MYLSFHVMVFEIQLLFFAFVAIYSILLGGGWGGGRGNFFLLKWLVYDYYSMRLSYLHFALYRSVIVFITFYSECECTHLFISTFNSILKLMFICSCCDIVYYVGGV